MPWVWVAIAVVNVAWCLELSRTRRHDHPWTLPFFVSWTASDLLMLLWSPHGFAALGPTSGPVWIAVASAVWASWYATCVVVAARLHLGRVPWWMWCAVVSSWLAVSSLDLLGMTTSARRVVLHGVYSPVCLIVSFIYVRLYVSQCVKAAHKEGIDYLAFAVQLTCIVLLLKIGLMLDKGQLVIWMAYIFHFIYMAMIMGYYVWKRKYLHPWLFYRS